MGEHYPPSQDQYLEIPGRLDRPYKDYRGFALSCSNMALREQLLDALETWNLVEWEQALQRNRYESRRWEIFRYLETWKRARRWLRENGIEPVPRESRRAQSRW